MDANCYTFKKVSQFISREKTVYTFFRNIETYFKMTTTLLLMLKLFYSLQKSVEQEQNKVAELKIQQNTTTQSCT